MADLSVNICGIESPNPFWLASAPPTNTGDQIARAFEAGWGGAVWKTVGEPIVNVSSRYGSVDIGGSSFGGWSDRGINAGGTVNGPEIGRCFGNDEASAARDGRP